MYTVDVIVYMYYYCCRYRKSVISKGQGSGSNGFCGGVCLKCPVCNKGIGLKELIIDK